MHLTSHRTSPMIFHAYKLSIVLSGKERMNLKTGFKKSHRILTFMVEVWISSLPPVMYGNLGCLGGNMYTSYEYVYKNSGVDDASYYPYTGVVSRL